MSRFKAELGRWWVAGEPNTAVVGYLDVAKPRGGPWRLTVEGRLAEMTPPGFDTHLAIHGHTASGEYTLLRAGTTSTRHGHIDTQQWRGWQLIKGGHVNPDQRFEYASFRLPQLWHWLGPSSLNYHTNDRFKADKDRREDNQVWTAHLDNGLQLDLGASFHERWGRNSKSWAGFGVYSLHGGAGLTLEDLEQVTLALTRLHAILAGSPMDVFGVSLLNDLEDHNQFEIVDAHPPTGSSWGRRGLKDFFFDTAEIDFTGFITEWMKMHHQALAAMAVAAPRDDRPFVTSKLVDTCNGLETLASYLWPQPEPTDKDRQLLDALRGVPEFNREQRDAVEFTLKQRRWGLEAKLVQLAATLGEESASWLLGPSLPHWAQLVARLRNSIAHGFSLPAGLSDNIPFMVTAQLSATAVLQLALLRQAGYRNAMSRTPGELLWSGTQHVLGHPNSAFAKDLESLASYADQWEGWYRRSQPPRPGPGG